MSEWHTWVLIAFVGVLVVFGQEFRALRQLLTELSTRTNSILREQHEELARIRREIERLPHRAAPTDADGAEGEIPDAEES